jgi:mannose/fructose/N-acetylgalactosamine-specific phosphotransferase system component IID
MAKTNVKLSEAAKKKAITRHNWALQWCWNYERMQAAGYAYSMVPVINELYDDNEERCRNLERHMVFYNTNPWTSALIFGADIALEEDYQGEVGDSLKVALMGPLAGIGDTISAVILTPIFSIITASLAQEQNYLSLITAIIPSLFTFVIRWPIANYAYKKGTSIMADVSGAGSFEALQVGASILGLVVIGGFIPSILSGLKIKDIERTFVNSSTGETVSSPLQIQSGLDAMLPYLIPVVLTAFCYWLIKVKKVSPMKTILIVFVLAFVCGALGIM